MLRKLTATLAVVIGMMLFVSPALADTVPTAKVVDSSTTATITGAQAKASDIATGKVVVLADMLVRPDVRPSSPRCFWTKGGFWNSGSGTNGKSYSFWDKVPGKLCPSKKSPTGYVKVAGGTSGRNCGNVASAKKPAFPVIRGKVITVRSFANVRVVLKAAVAVRVTAVCGWAEARAEAFATVSLRQYMKGSGPVETRLYAELTGKATAKASAQLSCVTTPPPPPPVPPKTPPPPPPGCQSNCTPPPTDVCPNITGNQSTVPAGYIKDGAGNCVIPPPPPVVHQCTITIGNAGKDNPYTANVSVSTDSAANVQVTWGDGQVSGPGSHTYPTPAPSPNAGDGVTYTIRASATYADGQSVSCGSGMFFAPAPTPSGNTNPPPPPPG